MLSRSSKQTLLTLVTVQLKDLYAEARHMKKACAFWYELATPENPHGFEMLNASRGVLRELKTEIEKLALVSKELKARLASDSSKRLNRGAKKTSVNNPTPSHRQAVGRATRKTIDIASISDGVYAGWLDYTPVADIQDIEVVDRSDWREWDYANERRLDANKFIVDALRHWKNQQ